MFGVKFGRDAFTMKYLREHKHLYPIVHGEQEYHCGLAGRNTNAANQLRVVYEHKQSNAQKQRYRGHHDDMAQVLIHVSHQLACLRECACCATWV